MKGLILAVRSLAVATLVMLLVIQPVLGSTKNGETTCAATKRVWVYSNAMHNVYHHYRFYYRYWWNPAIQYRENNTGYQSTWWVIEYDAAIVAPWGAFCGSI